MPLTATESQHSTRTWLALETGAAHEALHRHPLMGALLSTDLRLSQYHAALTVFFRVFAEVEASRTAMNVLSSHCLTQQIVAIANDLCRCPSDLRDIEAPAWARTEAALLGALYTCHGAALGAKVMAGHVARSLPFAPRNYFDNPGQSSRWRQLVHDINAVGADSRERHEIALGAHGAFQKVRELADELHGAFEAAHAVAGVRMASRPSPDRMNSDRAQRG